ncbi:hypothetical protein CMO96_03990 [Candidatus Woesebacteria bacterium]|nr:hypothetical protein [Candidatus Woesebacteria bacterium]|tara:strand:- start:159 stop:1073 length:915 start_codon:yes stop_codon:yes gene_type:complete
MTAFVKNVQNLLPLSGAVLVLMVFMGFASRFHGQEAVLSEATAQYPIPTFYGDTPELQLSARGLYAVDLNSGRVLISKNADQPLLPASTVKIATALVSLEHYGQDRVLTVGKVSTPGNTMGLRTGEQISVIALLYGLLVHSGNDAAEVLAANYPGGRGNFVAAMNALADRVGLTKTHFINPTGFDGYLEFSTPRDLVTLATYAVDNAPLFAEIVATPKVRVTSIDGGIKHDLVSTNKLVGKSLGVVGVKTGSTAQSGESLVTLVERDGTKIMIAILGSSDRFSDTETIINWIYDNYTWGNYSAP